MIQTPSFCHVTLASLLLLWTQLSFAQADVSSKYKLNIVRGSNLVNSVKKRVATEPIVEIRDENDRPVAGVAVTFTLPGVGPSGTFAGTNSQVATVITSANGQATAPSFTANTLTGSFDMRVSAAVQGQRLSAVIPMSNAAVAAAGISTGLLVGIIGGLAAGAAVGAVIATRNGGSSPRINVGQPTAEPVR